MDTHNQKASEAKERQLKVTKERLEIKEIELSALFGTIRAINSNAPESDLYKIFKFTLRSNLKISKLALYVFDETWECKTHFGTKRTYSKIPLDKRLLSIKERSEIPEGVLYFEEFDQMLPVKHKDVVLAYVFMAASDTQTDVSLMELDFIHALANIIIVAIENKKLARKELRDKEYNQQLNIAQKVQGMLFPKELPFTDSLKIKASYLPHHTIGGDYYDYIPLQNGKFVVCVADVSGKGIPAAILMSNFQAALRILLKREISLSSIVEELNTLVMQNSNGENFITAFLALVDPEQQQIKYINAGHNPPFLFQQGQVERLEAGTTVLGGFKELPVLEEGERSGIDDFMIFCFTDGFIETHNEAGEEFGDEYLLGFLEKNLHLDQQDLHDKLISLLNTFKGEKAYVDDITLLSCKVSW